MGSQYCQPSDLLLYAANPLSLQGVDQPAQVAACIAASQTADSYLNSRYPLPLLAWGIDITMHTAYIAVYFLMRRRGYNPGAGADDLIRDSYYEAVGWPDRPGSGWFPGIQRQNINPTGLVVSDVSPPKFNLPTVRTGGPSANRIRGWTSRGRWC